MTIVLLKLGLILTTMAGVAALLVHWFAARRLASLRGFRAGGLALILAAVVAGVLVAAGGWAGLNANGPTPLGVTLLLLLNSMGEEVVRAWRLGRLFRRRPDLRHAIGFGLGYGLGELAVLHALPVLFGVVLFLPHLAIDRWLDGLGIDASELRRAYFVDAVGRGDVELVFWALTTVLVAAAHLLLTLFYWLRRNRPASGLAIAIFLHTGANLVAFGVADTMRNPLGGTIAWMAITTLGGLAIGHMLSVRAARDRAQGVVNRLRWPQE
jgi:hypothetical protein